MKTIKIVKASGDVINGQMPLESFVAALIFKFDPPSILAGIESSGKPSAREVFLKMLGPMPTAAVVDGKHTMLLPSDKVEFPVQFDSDDLTRFLAKVAHGYAISKQGLTAFSEFFLPEYILGRTDGIQTYVGGYYSPVIMRTLPGGGYNRMALRLRNDLVSVCIQLFVDQGDPPPIYEVVVGRR